MLQLEKLHVMPQMTRVEANEETGTEGGYEYPERYQGKLFQIEDKIILFEKRKYQEFSLGMINLLSSIFVDENKLLLIKDDLDLQQNKKFDELAGNILEIQTDITNKLNSILEPLQDQIKQLQKDDKVQQLIETVELINKDIKGYVQSIVNSELKIVHDNFKIVVGQLVKEEVDKIKEIITKSENKLKPGQVAMFREMGLPISEIIELKQNGMI